MAKYIFITGGVVSSLGKGVAAASCGALLQSHGYKVHARKLDPYLNIDPGTMSPFQHGEVYVTDDGYETDLDLGYYERFLGIKLSRNDSVSGGRIYWDVLSAERRGDYLGKTVQMIPHVSDKIKEYITRPVDADFVICEIGGTVGDIEGKIFLESIRQLANDIGRRNVMFIHLTLAPYLEKSGELKTKPTQMSARNLLENGIQADMLIVRTPRELEEEERKKIGMFCNLPSENIISGIDVDNIYKIPMAYKVQNVFDIIANHFGLKKTDGDMHRFHKIEKYLSDKLPTVKIGMVGKYFDVPDAYKSLNEALFHAGIQNNVHINIKKIDSEKFSEDAVRDVDAILVPGGFGTRGIDGKIAAAKYARENKIPYMGICLGMQVAVIEFMRNVMGVKNADSSEFTDDCTPVIYIMSDHDAADMGGTLRLGSYPCVIKSGTLAEKVYSADLINERHRHRYEMDMNLESQIAKHGMIISGKSPDGKLPEIIELKDHPFFMAGQFHPEFQSSPYNGHPFFNAFVAAALKK
ncbi:MAG: CTP synthase [Alphaproteobacteria bacterium]|nr:CTP synthase [Alphaproteobacteria bacterium]MBN2675500.1 CTP synthase [Alphaproteobacteria bacterium]